jgi:H+/Cl- antiporter ClcA
MSCSSCVCWQKYDALRLDQDNGRTPMKSLSVSETATLLPWLVKWLLLACLVAALAGTASAWFMAALEWATSTRNANRWLILLLPVAGFISGWVYWRFGQSVEGGNNLLIDEIHEPQAVVRLRMAPMIFFTTVLSHLVGASVGREGTAVQIGGTLADQFTHLFKLNADERRIIMMTGISAGFASLFGTPLAGAVFGLEVIMLGHMRYNAILPCATAAVIGNQVALWWGIHHTHYAVPAVPPVTVAALLAVLAAGAAFGLAARAFAGLTHVIGGFMKRHIAWPPLRPVIGGAAIALVAWLPAASPYIGLGTPVIAQSLTEPVPLYAFAAKLLLTAASLGAGFKGGEVTPLFYIGATLGNALAPILQQPFALLAALGFVAVFASATNTPLAGTLLAMELFGSQIGIYALIACVVAYVFSGMSGIYRAQRIGQGKHLPVPAGMKLGDVPAWHEQQINGKNSAGT